MRTVSLPSLCSPRVLLLSALTAVLLLLTGLSLSLAPTPTAAAGELFVCVGKGNGQVYYREVCKKQETRINLNSHETPATLAVLTGDGQVFHQLVPKNANYFPLETPGETALTFCIEPTSARLYFTNATCPAGWGTLVVPPRNRPPVAEDTSAAAIEDGAAVPVTLRATDADGDVIGFEVTTAPTGGSLDNASPVNCTGTVPNTCTATIDYLPAPDVFGRDSFTYVAEDALGTSNEAVATIDIAPVNDAPFFTVIDGAVEVAEDSGAYYASWVATYSVGPSNESDQTFEFQVTDNTNPDLFAEGPSVDTDGALSFTPAENASGSAEITVQMVDSGGTANGGDDTSDEQTVEIVVGSANDAPSFALPESPDQTVLEDAGAQSVPGFATGMSTGPADEAGQSLVGFSVSADDEDLFAVQPAIDAVTGDLTYTLADDAFGAATIDVRLVDDGGTANGGSDTSDAQTFDIVVAPVNDAPSFTAGPDVTVAEDAGAYAEPWATDLSAGPANEADQTLTFTVTANSNPDLFAAGPSVASDGTLSFTQAANATGSATITLSVSDDAGTANGGDDTSAAQTFDITVRPPNEAPVAEDISETTAEDQPVDVTLSGTDADGDPLTFAITTQPANGSVDTSAIGTVTCDGGTPNSCTAVVTYTPDADDNGTDSFTYVANDGTEDSAAATASLTVTPVNDTPTATAQSQTTDEDTTLPLTLTGSDGDPEVEQALTFTISAGPAHGSLTGVDATTGLITGSLAYVPAANYNGPDSFTFTVTDDTTAGGAARTSAAATVSLTVESVNDAPTATGQSVSTTEDTARTIILAGTDVEGSTLTFVIGTGPTDGSLDTSVIDTVTCGATPNTCTASVTYTPGSNFNGADSFTFTVDDGTADSAAATVSITVTAVNDAPTLDTVATDALAYTENAAATAIAPALTVSDVDSTTLTGATVAITPATFVAGQDVLGFTNQLGIVLVSYNAATGVLTLDGDASPANYQTALRSVTYANTSQNPTPGNRTVSFQVDDGAAVNPLSNVATRTIAVTAVNDAPDNTVPSAVQTVNEDTNLVFNAANTNALSIADVDAGSGSITVTLDAPNGTVTLASTAGLAFAPGKANGTASVQATGTLASINTALEGLIYRGTLNYNGPDTLTITTNDQGNTGSPGALTTIDSVNITVAAVNDVPTAQAHSFTAQTNMQRSLPASGLLQNATDPDSGDSGFTSTLTVGSVKNAAETQTFTPTGGTITATIAGVGDLVVTAGDGSFTFNPAPGVTGPVSFKYTVCDNGNPGTACSATTTVTFTISGTVIWFVNPAASSNGDGRLTSPFQFLSGQPGAADDVTDVDAANHRVFVSSGTTTTGIALNSGEWLIGQQVTNAPTNTFDALFGITPPDGTSARPTIGTGTATVGGTVTLANSVTVRGIAVSTGTATGMSGTGGLTGVDVAQTSIATTSGTALSLNNVAGTLTFTNVSHNGAGTGISLTNVGATVSIAAGSIQGTTAAGVAIGTTGVASSGGNGAFSYAGTISTASGRTVEVQNRTGGTVTFSGAVSATGGTGVLLTNTAGTVTFSGGVQLSTLTNAAFTASGVGSTVTVSGSPNTLTTTTGTALSLNGIVGTLDFNSVSANAANAATTTGISLTNVGAGVTIGGGSIQATTTAGISINGGNGTFSYPGTVSNTSGRTIVVLNRTGGSVTFSGNLTGGGTGIEVRDNASGAPAITFSGATKTLNTGANAAVTLTNNTGSTISFTGGGLGITTAAGAGFSATGGGTVLVSGATNTIATGAGTALNVTNTTIGAAGTAPDSGLRFQSIAATGGTTGIVLNNTGTSGGLTVTGNGGTCTSAASCTGGAIQNMTGNGIQLTTTRDVSLSNMIIAGNQGSGNPVPAPDVLGGGVAGTNVTNFSLIGSTVANNANSADSTEAGLRFDNLLGTSAITSSTFSGQSEDHVRITNSGGVLTNLTVTGSTFNANSPATGGHGVALLGTGTANMTLSVTGSTFDDIRSTAVIMNLANSSVGNYTVSGNTFTDIGVAVTLGTSDSADLNFHVLNNPTILRAQSNVIQYVAGSTSTAASTIRGEISGNVIGNSTAGSGHVGQPLPVQYGIALDLRGDQNSIIEVSSNTTNHTEWEGIWISAADFGSIAGSPMTSFIVRDNAVVSIDDDGDGPGGTTDFPRFDIRGILIDFRHTTNGCLDIAGNASVGSPGMEHVRVRQRDTSVVRLERFSDGDATPNELINNEATVETFLVAQNDPGTTAAATPLVLGFTEAADGACGSPFA